MSDTIRRQRQPFATIPLWLLRSGVSDRAIRLYLVLGIYADLPRGAIPSRAKLADELGCARTALADAVRELTDVRALAVQERHREDGGRTTNEYVLMDLPPTAGAAPPYRPAGSPPLPLGRPPKKSQPLDHESEIPLTSFGGASPPKTAARGPHQNGGSSSEARAILSAWWEEQTPRPAQPYPACLKVVERCLAGGWPAEEVAECLRRAPAVSGAAMDFARRRGSQAENGYRPNGRRLSTTENGLALLRRGWTPTTTTTGGEAPHRRFSSAEMALALIRDEPIPSWA